MAITAQYASVPVFGSAALSAADTSLTTPVNVGVVLTAGANGTRIDYIEVIGTGQTDSGLVNIFVYDGTTHLIWGQIPVYAINPAATLPTFKSTISSNTNADFMPLFLPGGYELRAAVTTSQAGGLRVNAYGGDF